LRNKRVKLKYLVIPPIFLLIFSAIYFSLPYLFPTKEEREEKIKVPYTLIEDDPEIEWKITATYMSENNLVIEYVSEIKPIIEGLSSNRYRIEKGRVIVYDWKENEYFELVFGEDTVRIAFGWRLAAVIEYSMDNITYTESSRYVIGETLYSRLNIAEITGLSGKKINVSWSIIRAVDKGDFTTYSIPFNYIQLNILLESAPQIIFCPTDWSPYANTANYFRIDAVCHREGWQQTFTGQWFSILPS